MELKTNIVLRVIGLCLLLSGMNICYGQIRVFQNLTPRRLVDSIFVGRGVTVSNVRFTGSLANAIGHFGKQANGSPPQMFNRGIILSTGRVRNAVGPNRNTNLIDPSNIFAVPGASTDNRVPGDPDLNALDTARTFDAAVLEFNFIPVSDTIRFNYIFASEEYTEFVNSRFNDVFAFLISGPGISGLKNMAIIPNSTLPVSINNVNHIRNRNYYVDNPARRRFERRNILGVEINVEVAPDPGPFDLQYDGFTVPLTAWAVVEPCKTYRLKIAVADRGDPEYDSAVFLEANSFETRGYKTSTTRGAGGNADTAAISYEACTGDIRLYFTRTNTDKAETIPFVVKGTAKRGLDYDFSSPNIFFEKGKDSTYIDLITYADNIPEPIETIRFSYRMPLSCDSTHVDIFIRNVNPLSVDVAQNQVVCARPGQNTLTVTPKVQGTTAPIAFSWRNRFGQVISNAAILQMPIIKDTVIILESRYAFCDYRPTNDTIFVRFVNTANFPPLMASLSDTTICIGSNVRIIPSVRGGVGPVSYTWQDGSKRIPYIAQPVADQRYTVSITDGCQTVTVNVSVKVITERVNAGQDRIICPGDSVSLFAQGNDIFWFDEQNRHQATGNRLNITPSRPTFYVAKSTRWGCSPDTITVSYHKPLLFKPLTQNIRICAGQNLNLNSEVLSGTPPYRYQWLLNGNPIANTNPLTAVANATGTLTLVTQDACQSKTQTINLHVFPRDLALNISPNDSNLCPNTTKTWQANPTGGSLVYRYRWSNGDTTATVRVSRPNTYTVTVTDGCTSVTSAISVNQPPALQIKLDKKLIELCGNSIETVDAQPIRGNAKTYRWQGPGFNASTPSITLNNPQPGRYVLTATGLCDEQTTDTLIIKSVVPFNPPLFRDTTVCSGQKIVYKSGILDNNAVQVSWNGEGVTNPTAKNLELIPSNSGQYTVRFWDKCATLPVIRTFYVTVLTSTLTLPPITSNQNNSVCPNTPVTLSANGAGGPGNYRYTWSNGLTESSITVSPLNTTTYTLTLTDGCNQRTQTYTIEVFPAPKLKSIPDTTLCPNTSIKLFTSYIGGDNSPNPITWTQENNSRITETDNYLPSKSETITASYTDGCGRQTTTRFNLTLLQEPVFELPDTLELCVNSCTYLKPSLIEANGYAFKWQDYAFDSLQRQVCLNQTTRFTLIATHSLCQPVSKSMVVIANPRPVAALVESTLNRCAHDAVTLPLIVRTSGLSQPLTYSWQPTSGLDLTNPALPRAKPDSTTTYTLTLKDIKGCELQQPITATVFVHKTPVIVLSDTVFRCLSDEGVFLEPILKDTTAQYQVRWFPAFGLDDSTKLRPLAKPSISVTYSLIVTNSTGCASPVKTVHVAIKPVPNPMVIGDTTICFGNGITLGKTPEANYIYRWEPQTGLIDPNSLNTKAYPELTTSYTLVATSDLGCKAPAKVVTVQVIPRPIVVTLPVQPVCYGNSTQLITTVSGGEKPYLYTWITPDTTFTTTDSILTISPKESAAYYVKVQGKGCEAPEEGLFDVVVKEPFIININPRALFNTVAYGDTLRWEANIRPAIPPFKVRWFTKGDSTLSSENLLTPKFFPKVSRWYYLQIEKDGCLKMDSIFIRVVPKVNVKLSATDTLLCPGQSAQLTVRVNRPGVRLRWSPTESAQILGPTNRIVKPTKTTTYRVTAIDSFSIDSTRLTIRVLNPPKADFIAQVPDVCNPLTYLFTSTSSPNIKVTQWEFGNGQVGTSSREIISYSNAGDYSIKLKVVDDYDCKDSIVKRITVVGPGSLTGRLNVEPEPNTAFVLHGLQ